MVKWVDFMMNTYDLGSRPTTLSYNHVLISKRKKSCFYLSIDSIRYHHYHHYV